MERGERRYAEDARRNMPNEKRTLFSRCMQERNTGIFCVKTRSDVKRGDDILILIVYSRCKGSHTTLPTRLEA